MDKKQLHHLWTKIRPIKVWYLLILVVVSGAVTVFALRANNLKMVALRDAVYQADEKGGDVEAALQQLRAHVHGHMNTKLTSGNSSVYPPIQLKYTYQRLQQAANAQAQERSAQIYTDAQRHCERQNPTDFSGRNRVPCIEEYVSSHGVAPVTISDALYKFDFASPRWSPDLAGIGLAITILSAIALVLRVIVGRVLKSLTR